MNAGLAHTIDSLFGPASEKINVNAFIESAKLLYQDTPSNPSSSTIADECRFHNISFLARLSQIDKNFNSVSDIRDSLYNLWNNPTLSATLIRDHDHTIASLRAIVNPNKSRKTYHNTFLLPEISSLQKNTEAISLTAWR